MNATVLFTALSLMHLAPLCSGTPQTGSSPADPDIAAIVRTIRPERIRHTIETLVAFGTRNTLSAQDDPHRGIGAARDWIYSQFVSLQAASGSRLQVEKQTFTQPVGSRIPQPTQLTNLIATLPGDLPAGQERYVVISGHYDSMCTSPTDAIHDAPGADDDASGAAAVLECARALVPYKYHATIVFACVAGEEQGLYGSTYLAEQMAHSGKHVEAMLDNDIIGSSLGGNGVRDTRSVRVFSEGIASTETVTEARLRKSVGGEDDSSSRQLARFIRETAEQYVHGFQVRLVARRDRYLRGGDHIPFLERGYPAVRFTETNEDYHHQHQDVRVVDGVEFGDLPKFVDPVYAANVARVNAATLAALASGPAPPVNVKLITRSLSVDTELEWSAAPEATASGYEVVWRDTTDPLWTHSQPVGSVLHFTVKGLSKDNYFFGVRAVDAGGKRSPAVIPVPAGR
jgi:Zn-dependent M28 family amino/carboxypeptidase